MGPSCPLRKERQAKCQLCGLTTRKLASPGPKPALSVSIATSGRWFSRWLCMLWRCFGTGTEVSGMRQLIAWIFACHHPSLSWPRQRKVEGTQQPKFYQVCIACGREIEYQGELCTQQQIVS